MEITTLRANQSYGFGRESQRVEFLLMEKEGFCYKLTPLSPFRDVTNTPREYWEWD